MHRDRKWKFDFIVIWNSQVRRFPEGQHILSNCAVEKCLHSEANLIFSCHRIKSYIWHLNGCLTMAKSFNLCLIHNSLKLSITEKVKKFFIGRLLYQMIISLVPKTKWIGTISSISESKLKCLVRVDTSMISSVAVIWEAQWLLSYYVL